MASKKRVAREADSDYTARKKIRDEAPVDPSHRRITRLNKTDSPRKAVLNTSELLERIIVHMPMKDIFVIQRVCKLFNNVIATSPHIQTRMFLRLKDQPREMWKREVSSKYGVRKLLGSEKQTGHTFTPVVLNPVLKETPGPSHTKSVSFRPAAYPKWFSTQYVKLDLSKGHLEDNPSFLDMYITDPPCYMAYATLKAELQHDPDDPGEWTLKKHMRFPNRGITFGPIIRSDEGLTLGDLINARDFLLGKPGYADDENFMLVKRVAESCPLRVESENHPVFSICLYDVCFPTGEDWSAVSSEHTDNSA